MGLHLNKLTTETSMLHLPDLPSTQICQTFALLPRCGEDYENITLKAKMTLFS